MKSTMKKVLSFVLALAMVVVATVPAFAATGVVDPAEPNDEQIKFIVTKGGLKEDATATASQGTINKIDPDVKGEYELTDGDFLEPSTTYVIEMDEDAVEEGTPSRFAVTTNAKGQIESIKAITVEDDKVVDEVAVDVKDADEFQFEFKLVNPAAEEGYTVFTRLQDGSRVEEDVEVTVYPVKVKDGEYAYADGSAINQVDYDGAPLGTFTVPAGSRTEDSAITFNSTSTPTLDEAKTWVTTDDLPIVALVAAGKDGEINTKDDVVVFTNFSKDKQAVLTLNDGSLIDLKVIVKGLNNPTVAVPGATVEIQKNSTKLFGPESFGEAIATGRTNSNGEVVFNDIKVSELLRYLSDDAIVNNVDYDDAFKQISLPFRAVVTAAEGYTVPVGVTLTADEIADGVVEIELVPSGSGNLINRLKGSDRYATSAAIARELYGDPDDEILGSRALDFVNEVGAEASEDDAIFEKKNIILANGHDFADALTANGLTSYYDAPILLTDGNRLSPEVQKFIDDYDVESVIIVGGEVAVSSALEAQLERDGLITTRLKGANRYGTAAAVADRIATFHNGTLPILDVDEAKVDTKFQVFVASGMDFADALVASVPAATYGAPILLTRKDSVPAETKATIDKYNLSGAIVVGGDAAVSPSTYSDLNIATKERIYGANRQLTSMKLAERFFPQAGSAFIAGRTRFPDALAGGALAAEKEAPILLSDGSKLDAAVRDYIVTHRITDVTILGGSNAVSEAVRTELQAAVLQASR